MDIFFLGTGDAYNTDGLASQSILIKTSSLQFLVDAGPTSLYQMRALGLNPGELDFIFFTHFHGDHTAGFPFIILYFQKQMAAPVLPKIIGPVGIKKCCFALFNATFKGTDLKKGLSFKEIKTRVQKNISIDKGLSFDVYPMKHHRESIGFRFHLEGKIIAVSGDTGIHEGLLHLTDNADIAIIECSTLGPEYPSHTSAEELSRILPRMNAKKVVPIHTTTTILNEIKKWNEEKVLIVTDKQKVSIQVVAKSINLL